jgi:fructosamine-3-kinase
VLDSIPSSVLNAIRDTLQPADLQNFSLVSGGCINWGGKLTTSAGDYFIKWNDRSAYPAMFETEAKGLRILQGSQSIRVNEVIGVGECEAIQFIILEWINRSPKLKTFWTLFGQQLAALHQHTAPSFGLDHDNYIGSLQQLNHPWNSWSEFFIHQRLEPQIKLAMDHHHPVLSLRTKMERMYKKIPALLPEEAPALLHGDLWGGNLLTDERGCPCLIDPAVCYGHREAELAFTQLFGPFDQQFYHVYNESFPVEPGFEERAGLYNLYPVLVHINLFGGGYIQQAESLVSRFV